MMSSTTASGSWSSVVTAGREGEIDRIVRCGTQRRRTHSLFQCHCLQSSHTRLNTFHCLNAWPSPFSLQVPRWGVPHNTMCVHAVSSSLSHSVSLSLALSLTVDDLVDAVNDGCLHPQLLGQVMSSTRGQHALSNSTMHALYDVCQLLPATDLQPHCAVSTEVTWSDTSE